MQPQPLFIIPETALRLSLRARLQRARNCGLMSKFACYMWEGSKFARSHENAVLLCT